MISGCRSGEFVHLRLEKQPRPQKRLNRGRHQSERLAVLVETNVVGVLLETAAADVKAVLANDTDARSAGAAAARALAVALRVRTPDVSVTHVETV